MRVLVDVPLHQHWHDVYVKRWLVVLTATSAAVVAYIFSILVTPIYEAKSTFYLAANASPPRYVSAVPDVPPGPLMPTPEEKAASLDVGILRGREVRTRLADQFGLTVAEIERRVDVTVSGEFMIDVFARNPDAGLAADIANAVPEVYSDFHERSMRMRATASADALAQHLVNLTAQRDEMRNQLRESRSASLTTADQSALEGLQGERDAVRKDVDSLTEKIAAATAKQTAMQAALDREAGFYALAQTIETTPTLDKMMESILTLRAEMSTLREGATSQRRAVIEDQLTRIDEAVVAERIRLATAETKASGSLFEELRLEMALNQADIAGLQSALAAANLRLADATKRFDLLLTTLSSSEDASVGLTRINAQITVAQDNLAAAVLQSENATPPIVIVESASPPTRPAFPLPLLNAVVAALCGVVFGTYYALFVAHSERSVQVRRSRDAPILLFSQSDLEELTAPTATFLRSPRPESSGDA